MSDMYFTKPGDFDTYIAYGNADTDVRRLTEHYKTRIEILKLRTMACGCYPLNPQCVPCGLFDAQIADLKKERDARITELRAAHEVIVAMKRHT